MANFSYSPNYVNSQPPIPNIEVTRGKSFKQTTYKLDNNFIRKYDLFFGSVDSTMRTNLKNHFEGQFGPYSSFSWTNPPTYVSGTALTVRYDEESAGMGYEEDTPPVGGNVFTITLHFAQVVS